MLGKSRCILFAPERWFKLLRRAQYLGLQYHNRKGLHASIKKLEQRFWASWIDLQREYNNLRCDTCIELMLDLSSLVFPLSYLMGAKSGPLEPLLGIKSSQPGLLVVLY